MVLSLFFKLISINAVFNTLFKNALYPMHYYVISASTNKMKLKIILGQQVINSGLHDSKLLFY